MGLFDDSAQLSGEKQGRQIKAVSGRRDKLPETPDFTEWGKEPRKGSPFALDSFSSGAPENTTKP